MTQIPSLSPRPFHVGCVNSSRDHENEEEEEEAIHLILRQGERAAASIPGEKGRKGDSFFLSPRGAAKLGAIRRDILAALPVKRNT